ncbi:MAG TPA: hypothetical protein VGW38_09240 [Chloroflexota bacterium]|nr:hypothetical protein [Chloroflexota bacterium]
MRVSIRIGRNIGQYPMIPRWWRQYNDRIRHLFDVNGYNITVVDGIGEWDGVREENATYTGRLSTLSWNLLSQIAYAFHQDTIAVLLEGSTHWLLVHQDGGVSLGADKYEQPSILG